MMEVRRKFHEELEILEADIQHMGELAERSVMLAVDAMATFDAVGEALAGRQIVEAGVVELVRQHRSRRCRCRPRCTAPRSAPTGDRSAPGRRVPAS